MVTTTLATVDNLLKEIYEPGLNDQLNNATKTLTRIEKTSDGVEHDVGGKYVSFAIRTKRNNGIGARLEMEALPAAGQQAYERARVGLKYLYGSLELTGQTLELAKTNEQAFVNVLDAEMAGIKQTLAKDTNRQVYGTSTGKFGTANAVGTTTTLVVPNEQNIYFEVGQVIDIYDNADAVRASGKTITAISVGASNTTITFTTASGTATASGDYAVRAGNRAKEIIGLSEIIGTSNTVYNINPATVPVWQSVVNANGGTNRALSEGLMIKLVDDIGDLGGGMPTVIFCSRGVRRSYFNLLVQQRQFVNTQKFEGGFTGLAFTTDDGEIPVVSDVDCPKNKMFAVNEKELKFYAANDWGFMNRDGSMWQRVINSSGNFDAYDATLFKYCELGTHRRNAHGMLSDITEG